MKSMSSEKGLRTLGLLSLDKRRLKCDLTALYSSLSDGSGEVGVLLLSVVSTDKTHGNA